MKTTIITLAVVVAAPLILLTIVGLYYRKTTGRGSKRWPWLVLALCVLSTGCQTLETKPLLIPKPPVEFTSK